jgi:hypothetical protein
MDAAARIDIIARLSAAFGGAQDVTPEGDQPLHVLLPQLELPDPWKPSPTRALAVWRNWPAERPLFVIDEGVVGENDEPPRSNDLVYLLGEGWRSFSFSFNWNGNDPVQVIQRWMTRFVAERS